MSYKWEIKDIETVNTKEYNKVIKSIEYELSKTDGPHKAINSQTVSFDVNKINKFVEYAEVTEELMIEWIIAFLNEENEYSNILNSLDIQIERKKINN
jgi:hypothetical protein